MRPITSPATGSSTSTKMVSCHEKKIMVPRYTMMRMGFLKSMSRLDITDASTSWTSPERRAMTSPLRVSEKKPIGSESIFRYIWLRTSRTTPLRSGIMKYMPP